MCMYLFIYEQTAGPGQGVCAPRLPHPAAKALAVPTTLMENMDDIQNWQQTKVASAKPMKHRHTMKPADDDTIDMEKTARGTHTVGLTFLLIGSICNVSIEQRMRIALCSWPHLLGIVT